MLGEERLHEAIGHLMSVTNLQRQVSRLSVFVSDIICATHNPDIVLYARACLPQLTKAHRAFYVEGVAQKASCCSRPRCNQQMTGTAMYEMKGRNNYQVL